MGAERTTCPTPKILERLLSEQLDEHERDFVEAHVETCNDCQSRLYTMFPSTNQQMASATAGPGGSDFEPDEEFMIRLGEMLPPTGQSEGGSAGLSPVGGGASWREGDRLGPYEILAKLGNGSMGVVYKARHRELGKVVALKMLKREQADEVAIARFKNEIRAVGRLEHPNIVVAHDAGEFQGIHYLVMQYVDGMDLARLVDRCGRLSIQDACEVIRQAAIGLHHAYERELVHRDIKPSNLILAADGQVRLLDLGLARSFGETPTDTLTAAGMLLGTADYLAPEQWDHPHAADVRADIYSLGCTLYHLLAGKAPFDDPTYRSVLSKMRAHVKVPPPIKQQCPMIPARLSETLSRMLAKNPMDRFATPAEAASALEAFTTGCDLPGLLKTAEDGKGRGPTTGEKGKVAFPNRRRDRLRWRPFAVIGSLLLLVGVLTAVTAFLAPRFWRSSMPNVAMPLEITELRVNHYRGKEGKLLGDIRHTAEAIKLNDSVRVYARLSAPAYAYLIAFNPDGSEQLCHPAWEGDQLQEARATRPEPVTEVRFFPDDKGVFSLDSAGLQVFVLVTSTQPLPPYSEWRAGAGDIPWKPVSHGGEWRWQFNGKEFTRLPLERGKHAERDAEPQALSSLCAFFSKRPEFEAFQVIAFPVINEDPMSQLDGKAADLCREGKFLEAREPLREKVALLAERKGENHTDTDDARRSLKTIEQIASKPEEARAAFVESYQVSDQMSRLLKKGNYPAALPLAKRVLELRRQVLGEDHESAAVATFSYAQVLHSCARYAEAEDLFRKALVIIRRVGGENHPAVAKVSGALAISLDAQDKYGESGPFYESDLQITRTVHGEDSAETAVSMNNLAGHYDRQARFDESEALYRKSLDILIRAEGEGGKRVDIARNNLAYNLGEQGRFGEAETIYRDVLRARRKNLGDEHPDTAMSFSNLAGNLDEQGRHAEAEPFYHKALNINRNVFGEENTKTAISLNNLAMNLQHQRKYEEANPYFRKALEIHVKLVPGGNRSAAGVHHNLAANLQGQGQFDAAWEQLEKSLAILQKVLGDSHPDVAQDYIGMASVLSNQKKYDEAEPLVRKAADLMNKALGPEHPRTIQAQISLANNLHNQDKFSEADSLLKDCLEAQRKAAGEGNPTTTWTYLNRISNLWAQGKYREIEGLGPAAAASFEAARPRFSAAGLDRTGRALELSPMLTYLAAAAARNDHPGAAWQYLESRLARGLFDDLSAKPLTEAERDKERTILSQVSRLNQQIAAQTDRSEVDKLRIHRDEVQTRLADLRSELAAKYGVPAGKPYDLQSIQKQLPADTALIGWIDVAGDPKHQDPQGAHWVCVVRRHGEPICVRLGGGGRDGAWLPEDNELPAKVRNALAEKADTAKEAWKDLIQKLYAQRLAPIESQLGPYDALPETRHVIVLPANVMAGIPIEALTDRFTVSYVPSGTTFAWLINRRNELADRNDHAIGSLLAVGDPNFQRSKPASEGPTTIAERQESFTRLPASRKEIQAVARVFSHALLLKDSEASEQNLERMAQAGELRNFRFLHFATHGLLDDRQALNSALILAQDKLPDPLTSSLDSKPAFDGRLTAAEILRNWKLDADLVTLSACETALGKFSGGEGYLGFSQALFLAGARGMVLSLWRVDDRATALLMTRFYENMLGTPGKTANRLTKAQALAEAKQWLRRLSAADVERLTSDLSDGLPGGTRGTRKEAPNASEADNSSHPFEHPNYWSAFILIGDPS
jgi:CHAT domain-containing protein/tetratricopeptide (TPR) repeat protein/tRNA A-37 threonylcarbamoyl transferase component Bud32